MFYCCSKNTLHQIYDYVSNSGGPKLRYGLTFSYFIELLDHVAQNCLYSTRNVHGPYSRVRTMFHVMNSSRGRIKLAKDSSETIINPLTGLDTAEPTSFHKQPPQQQQQQQQQQQPTKSSPQQQSTKSTPQQQISRALSLTPQSNSSLKKSSKSGQATVSTPRRSSSIGFTTPSPNQISNGSNPSSNIGNGFHHKSNNNNNHHHHRASISGMISTQSNLPTPTTPTSPQPKKMSSKINSKK